MAEKCFMENYFAEKWANVLLKKWSGAIIVNQMEKSPAEVEYCLLAL